MNNVVSLEEYRKKKLQNENHIFIDPSEDTTLSFICEFFHKYPEEFDYVIDWMADNDYYRTAEIEIFKRDSESQTDE